MAVVFMEPGTAASRDVSLFSLSQNVASNSSVFRNNGRSLEFNFSTSTSSYVRFTTPTTGRISWWLRVSSTITNTTQPLIMNWRWSGNGAIALSMGMQTTAPYELNLIATSGIIGTVGLSNYIDTWIRISVAWQFTSVSSYRATVRVYGPSGTNLIDSFTLTNVNGGNLPSGTGTLTLGEMTFFSATTGTAAHYVSDLYVDDVSTDTDPGNISVTVKLPNSSISGGFDTLINGANRWSAVNDRPPFTSSGIQQQRATVATETFGIESASQGDTNITGATIVASGVLAHVNRTTGTSRLYFCNYNTIKGTGTAINLASNGPYGSVVIGDVVIVTAGSLTTAASINDSAGHTWTALTTGTNTVRVQAWYTIATATGFTVTVTFPSTNVAKVAALYRVPDTIASPFDVNPAMLADSTSPYTSNLSGTLATQPEILVGYFGLVGPAGDTITVSSPDTRAINESGGNPPGTAGGNATTNVNMVGTYRVVTATTSVAVSMANSTANRTGIAGIVGFKLAAQNDGSPNLVLSGTDYPVTIPTTISWLASYVVSSAYPTNIGIKSGGGADDDMVYEIFALIAYIPPDTWFPQYVGSGISGIRRAQRLRMRR